jgi:MFS family permease
MERNTTWSVVRGVLSGVRRVYGSCRMGKRSVWSPINITVAMVGAAVVTALVGILSATASLGMLISLRVLFGVFSAPLFPSAGALTVRWFRREQYGRVQGLVSGATGVGGVGPPVVIATIVAVQGWRASYLYTAAATVLLAVLWSARVRDGVRHKEQIDDPRVEMRDLLRNRTLWLLTLSYGAAAFFTALFDNWIYYYFREVRHYTSTASAWFTTATQISILVGTPFGGWLADRLKTIRRKQLFVVGVQSVSATSLVCASLVGDYTITIILFCTAYGVSSLTDACFSAMSLEVGGAIPASSYSVVNTGFAGGTLIGSVAIPAIAGAEGWTVAIHATSAVVLAGASLWLLIPCPSPREIGAQFPS